MFHSSDDTTSLSCANLPAEKFRIAHVGIDVISLVGSFELDVNTAFPFSLFLQRTRNSRRDCMSGVKGPTSIVVYISRK